MTPASIAVSAASGTYAFSGGPIDGSGSLTKSGAGGLTLGEFGVPEFGGHNT